MNSSPRYFYKFRSLSGNQAKYVERTICNNEIFSPAPSSFNDPFDCRPIFSFEASDTEKRKYFNAVAAKKLPNPNRRERRAFAKDGRRHIALNSTQQEVRDYFVDLLTKKIGVYCLSEVRDDILMWSHYADSHRGVCLEFDGYIPDFAGAHQILYRSERRLINPFRDTHKEMVDAALLTKASHWAYEKEWRIVGPQGPGVRLFAPRCLTGIIFGAQIAPSDAEKVLKWIKRRTLPMKVYRAAIDKAKYAITIVES